MRVPAVCGDGAGFLDGSKQKKEGSPRAGNDCLE
jgi:hypothetical protein